MKTLADERKERNRILKVLREERRQLVQAAAKAAYSVFKWTGGNAPTLSTTASAYDYFVFRSDGTNLYEQGRALNDS